MADLFQNNINKYLGDVARSAKFSVQFELPPELNLTISLTNNSKTESPLSGTEASRALEYFCYGASFPGMVGETIDFKYLGRTIPVPGVVNPTQTFTATFYNDEKHGVRKLFKEWIELYQYWNTNSNETTRVRPKPATFMAIYQLDFKLKNNITFYCLYNPFPVSMSDIEVSYENLNQVETFTVEFRFTHYDIGAVKNNGLSQEDVSQLVKSAANDIVKSAVNAGKDMVKNIGKNLLSSAMSNLGINDMLQSAKNTTLDLVNSAKYKAEKFFMD